MKEIKLPCSDCGTGLVERAVHARESPISTDWLDRVCLAECPECNVRYCPKRALARLAGTTDRRDPPEGS